MDTWTNARGKRRNRLSGRGSRGRKQRSGSRAFQSGSTRACEERSMRVVSLLPAATEIVAALGLADQFAGVSHECDYPSEVNDKPRVTRCQIHGAGLPSAEVDRWVRETLAS